MKLLVVTSHPRPDSLTANIAKRFTAGLSEAGHEYEVADLYAEKFNPLLFPEDEPDWDHPNKIYSEEVIREMKRIEASEALVFIFPVWWYSLPAILKGYIDRVWNYGFAYGPTKLPVQKIRWIAMVGFSEEQFKKRDYDRMMEHHLNIGLADYCGVKDSIVHFMYNTLGEFERNAEEEKEKYFAGLLDKAYQLGAYFG
ncbi:NAD(P)H oxidoreductase [Siminovitchia sediminis]|uniref:NAD(P)H oxidoreductase n=1 Tax=Siminovitchia sediminis TaxID=1274353 RepID=A0ABW4KMZ6_9BACI